uniref:Uncharacterized protein n=1 Tax=Aegilops tauschii subsp. strangulata TaxID=200361 RepID=A0A453IPQ0_AEGTS
MAMKGPGLFTDIGKKAKDLLTRDYTYDQKLSVSTVSSSGVVRIPPLPRLDLMMPVFVACLPSGRTI